MPPKAASSSVGVVPAHRILIADDDSFSRVGMARLLEHEGFACDQVTSGPEALKLLSTSEVSAVVADINMEGNTRLELLNQLREKVPHLSIILVTGRPSIETAAAATSLRAAAYLLKPVEPSQLVNIVRRECEQLTLFNVLRSRRLRQEEVLQSMHALENAFAGSAGSAAGTALQSYVAISFDQTVQSLMDLKRVVDTLTQQERSSDLFSTARPLVLVDAIRETISVLERTRSSFKSKELAALRRKLEDLLAQPGAGAASRPPMSQPRPAPIPGCSVHPLGIMMNQ